jgi:hypothetical protein
VVSYHGMKWHIEKLGMNVTRLDRLIYFERWLGVARTRFVVLSRNVAPPGTVAQSFDERWNKR